MNRQLPVLRGLAIVIVVFYHSLRMGMLGPPDVGYAPVEGVGRHVLLALLQLGIFAVPAFLFISGVFAAYASRGPSRGMGWGAVWAGLKRILMPYVIWSIVFYLVVYLRRDEAYSFVGYVKNLVVGYPFHFVPILVFFYALSPVLARLTHRLGWGVVGAFALYQILLMAIVFPGVLGVTPPAWADRLVPPVLGSTLAQWGIYFPLGLVYGLQSRRVSPWLHRFRWALWGTTGLLFVLSLLDLFSVLHFPAAKHLSPIPFLLGFVALGRVRVPAARSLDGIGKRSYGLYLIHLIVLDFIFLGIYTLIPVLLDHQLLFQPLLFALGGGISYLLMEGGLRLLPRGVYRYVFGA